MENDQVLNFNYEKLQSYLKVGDPGHINSNIYDFCDEKLYESINKAKVCALYLLIIALITIYSVFVIDNSV